MPFHSQQVNQLAVWSTFIAVSERLKNMPLTSTPTRPTLGLTELEKAKLSFSLQSLRNTSAERGRAAQKPRRVELGAIRQKACQFPARSPIVFRYKIPPAVSLGGSLWLLTTRIAQSGCRASKISQAPEPHYCILIWYAYYTTIHDRLGVEIHSEFYSKNLP